MIRHEMIELLGWRYQDMTEAQQDVLSRVENIVEVAVLRERDKTICAAELRRLSEIETLYLAAMRGRHAMSEELLAVTAQRDALLEALKDATKTIEHLGYPLAAIERARAAIKAAEENT